MDDRRKYSCHERRNSRWYDERQWAMAAVISGLFNTQLNPFFGYSGSTIVMTRPLVYYVHICNTILHQKARPTIVRRAAAMKPGPASTWELASWAPLSPPFSLGSPRTRQMRQWRGMGSNDKASATHSRSIRNSRARTPLAARRACIETAGIR